MSFIDNYFKTFLDKLFIERPELTKVVKKILFLPFPYLGEILYKLQSWTKHLETFLRFSIVSFNPK